MKKHGWSLCTVVAFLVLQLQYTIVLKSFEIPGCVAQKEEESHGEEVKDPDYAKKVVDLESYQLIEIDNKYRERDPVLLEEIIFGIDATKLAKRSSCHLDIDVLWRAEIQTQIYNAPVIYDINSDGHKELIFATNSHYIEVLDHHGHKLQGWPFAFSDSGFVASPLLYDIDNDGFNEIVVTTENAEIAFLKRDGVPLLGSTLVVPPLKAKKNWYREMVDEDEDDVALSYTLTDDKEEQHDTTRKLLQVGEDDRMDESIFQGVQGWLTDEGIQSLELFLVSDTPENYVEFLKLQQDPLYSSQYERYLNSSEAESEKGYVFVDAHVLNTPVIADLDNDGVHELIVAVSYYFDSVKYSNPKERAKLPVGLDISKYVAGGIVVFDLGTLEIKWTLNLDMTTDLSLYTGYIYTSPTVVDMNHDNMMEIIIPTGVGFVYAIDHQGKLLHGLWPLMMDSIFAQVAAEDINGDGNLELIVCDTNSNVIAYSLTGEEIWESRISGYPNQPVTIGDVDGNGVLDLVVGTTEGHLWALRGDNGVPVPFFPVKLKGRVQSQALLISLNDRSSSLHIVVSANDGHLYVVDGATACFEKFDLGEVAYGMVLADDITGNGKMDLVVTTKSGTIYVLSTDATYHPLKSWTSQGLGLNGFTVRDGYQAVYVTEASRGFRDIVGDQFYLQIHILDNRPKHKEEPHYDVKVLMGQQVLLSKRYHSSGHYTELIASPPHRTSAVLTVQMTNEFGQTFFDHVTFSFNMHFHKLLKWILVVPFALMAVVMLFIKELTLPLPLSI